MTSCYDAICPDNRMCVQLENMPPVCIVRNPNVTYCADWPCSMAEKCFDDKDGYTCVSKNDSGDGECWIKKCEAGQECMQKKGKRATCFKEKDLPKCPANEIYTDCAAGCDTHCLSEENPSCTKLTCSWGCKCKSGFLRKNGICVPVDKCNDDRYGGNKTCEHANCPQGKTCVQAFGGKPKCVDVNVSVQYCKDSPCAIGMECYDDENGRECRQSPKLGEGECIHKSCSWQQVCFQEKGQPSRCVGVTETPIKCGNNEEYSDCFGTTERTCNNPAPTPNMFYCTSGCRCKEGYVRIDGICKSTYECPPDYLEEGLTCDAAYCLEGKVCATESDGVAKCVYRQPGQTYCVDKPCNMAMKCTDGSYGYYCYGVENGSPGECFNKACPTGQVCRQKHNEYSLCIYEKDAPKCPKNEIYTDCMDQCDPTCDISSPSCDEQNCNRGCRCRKGFVRHNGKCVAYDSCPPSSSYSWCNQTEEYYSCKPKCVSYCNGTKVCEESALCDGGCFCKENYKRSGSNKCVHNSLCYKDPGCNVNEHYSKCINCDEKPCGPSAQRCSKRFCNAGCACDKGFQRFNGTCITEKTCARKNV